MATVDRLTAVLVVLLGALAGCASLSAPPIVHQPMTARPLPTPPAGARNGSIYQADNARLALFEDRRARFVGDTITILIEEKTNASKATSGKASKDGSISANISGMQHVPGKTFLGLDVQGSDKNEFEGKGATANNNVFTGTITCTVIEVLGNGNLLVSGEKQLTIGQGTEFIRFSGVINPTTVGAANTVSSGKVADARIEYRGNGYVDEAQTMNWLQRFFLSVLPI